MSSYGFLEELEEKSYPHASSGADRGWKPLCRRYQTRFNQSSGDLVPDGGTEDGASGGRGRFGGGGFTPIAGTLASIDSTGVTVTTTQGESVVPIPPETPVRLEDHR